MNLSRVLRHDWHEPSWPEGSVLRTPAERFSHLPDFRYEPQFAEIEGLRMAYVEAGHGQPILMLHGEPTWGYLYRRMIPTLAEVGRVIVPDLIGFGRSDKPVNDNTYSYRSHARWLRHFIESSISANHTGLPGLGRTDGLRVLSETPGHFSRLVAMNTGIPDGRALGDGFMQWRRYAQRQRQLDAGGIVQSVLTMRTLTDAEVVRVSRALSLTRLSGGCRARRRPPAPP